MSKKQQKDGLATREAVGAFLKDCQYGDVEGVKRFVVGAKKRDEAAVEEVVVETRDSNGRTGLHFAAFEGQTAVAEYLLQVAPGAKECRDDEGNTALILAAEGSRLKAIKLLLDAGCDVNAANKTGVRAIHHASGNGELKILALLKERGADLEAASEGGRPLHWAAGARELAAVRCLLEWGAAVDAPNTQGLSAIILAAAAGADEVVELLAGRGADCGMILSGNVTLLHICCDLGCRRAVRALAGTDAGRKCALLRNGEGLLPVQCAATHGHADLVELLLPLSNCSLTAEQLLEEGRERAAREEAEQQRAEKEKAPEPAEDDAMAEPGGVAADEGDKARAQELKQRGNECFKAKDFPRAWEYFNQAISVDGSDATFFSNRAACHMEMGLPKLALADANRARQLRPAWPKVHYRRAVALLALGRHEPAATAAWDALRLDEDNEEVKVLLQKAVGEGRKAARLAA